MTEEEAELTGNVGWDVVFGRASTGMDCSAYVSFQYKLRRYPRRRPSRTLRVYLDESTPKFSPKFNGYTSDDQRGMMSANPPGDPIHDAQFELTNRSNK